MLGLTLLLNHAAQALDCLALLQMEASPDILTPEYRDPGLVLAIEQRECPRQSTLRARLAQQAAQLRVVGPAASAAAILAGPETGRRLAALLALAGAASWEPIRALPRGGELHRRVAADGSVYLLAGVPDAGAAHAPHAVRGYAQRMWVLPPGHPCADGATLPAEAPLLQASEALDCLSLQAALRDLAWALRRDGADALAARLAELGAAAPLADAPGVPLPAQATPAVAA